jgi:hypothetical protein
VRDLRAGPRLSGLEPFLHPVDHAHRGEDHELGRARHDAAVGDALLDECAQPALELVAPLDDPRAVGWAHRAFLEQHDRGAVMTDQPHQVVAQREHGLLAPVAPGTRAQFEAGERGVHRQLVTTVEQVALVLDVVVERRLRQPEVARDRVERGAVVARLAEGMRGLADEYLELDPATLRLVGQCGLPRPGGRLSGWRHA